MLPQLHDTFLQLHHIAAKSDTAESIVCDIINHVSSRINSTERQFYLLSLLNSWQTTSNSSFRERLRSWSDNIKNQIANYILTKESINLTPFLEQLTNIAENNEISYPEIATDIISRIPEIISEKSISEQITLLDKLHSSASKLPENSSVREQIDSVIENVITSISRQIKTKKGESANQTLSQLRSSALKLPENSNVRNRIDFIVKEYNNSNKTKRNSIFNLNKAKQTPQNQTKANNETQKTDTSPSSSSFKTLWGKIFGNH